MNYILTLIFTLGLTGTSYSMQNVVPVGMDLTTHETPQHGQILSGGQQLARGEKRKDAPAPEAGDGTPAQPAKKAKIDGERDVSGKQAKSDAETATAASSTASQEPLGLDELEESKLSAEDKQLFDASMGRSQEVEELKKKIAAGWDIDKRDERGDTQLIVALNARNERLAENLIKAGADVTITDKHGATPLMLAAGNGDIKLIELMLNSVYQRLVVHNKMEHFNAQLTDDDEDVDYKQNSETQLSALINSQDKYGVTPLMRAAAAEHLTIVDLLLQCGAQVNICNNKQITAYNLVAEKNKQLADRIQHWPSRSKELVKAVAAEDLKTVKELIEAGASLFFRDHQNTLKPLAVLAIQKTRNIELVKLLLNANAHNNILPFVNSFLWKNQTNNKCLENYAIENYEDDDVDEALEKEINAWRAQVAKLLHTYKPYSAGDVLFKAVQDQDMEAVQQLLKEGADINSCASSGVTVLIVAASNNNIPLAKLALSAGVQVNAFDEDGETALTTACYNGFTEMVQLLLEYKANPNIGGGKTTRALNAAIANGHTHLVEPLLRAGADVNYSDWFGKTPLMLAAENGSMEMVQLFIKHKAHINTQSQGVSHPPTALTYAVKNNHLDIAQVLIKAGAQLNLGKENPIKRDYALEAAAENGHLACVKLLLDHGVPVDHNDSYDYKTALHEAAENGHLDVVKLLLDKGADINKSLHSISPLMAAIRNKHVAVVKLLIERKASLEPYNKQVRVGEAAQSVSLLEGAMDVQTADDNNHLTIIKLLLDAGIPADTESGSRALQRAVFQGRIQIVKLLLNAGADVTAKNIDNATPGQPTKLNILQATMRRMIEFGDSLSNATQIGEQRTRSVYINIFIDLLKLLNDAMAKAHEKLHSQQESKKDAETKAKAAAKLVGAAGAGSGQTSTPTGAGSSSAQPMDTSDNNTPSA